MIERQVLAAHGGVERLLAGMAERRVADVMNQCQCLDQINVQAESAGNGARNLRDLNGVGQPVAEMIGIAAGENLGFSLEPAKSAGVDNTVAVPLKVVAVR